MHLTLSAFILGVINIGIIVAILLIVGLVIVWVMGMFGYAPPPELRKMYILLVALVALYELVALLFGLPAWHPLALT